MMATGHRESTDYEQYDETLPIDDHQIMNMSVKELNTLLKSMRPDDAANVKRRRRILKNKGYAASSRSRQTSLVGQLSNEREQLIKQIDQLKQDNDTLLQELRGWKQRYTDLQLLTSPLATSPSTDNSSSQSITSTDLSN